MLGLLNPQYTLPDGTGASCSGHWPLVTVFVPGVARNKRARTTFLTLIRCNTWTRATWIWSSSLNHPSDNPACTGSTNRVWALQPAQQRWWHPKPQVSGRHRCQVAFFCSVLMASQGNPGNIPATEQRYGSTGLSSYRCVTPCHCPPLLTSAAWLQRGDIMGGHDWDMTGNTWQCWL